MIGKTRRALQEPPRGILHRIDSGGFAHWRGEPPPELASWVEHFWSVRWNLLGQPAQVQETLPHPNVHLVVEPAHTACWGVHSGRFTKLLDGRGFAFGIKFRPGAFRPFLGHAVSRLMDASAAIDAVFGCRADALAAIDGDTGDTEAAEIAATFLRERLPAADPQVDRAAAIVACIVDDRGIGSVAELSRRSGVSPRALQRLFGEYVGVPPKWVINRYRMHEAVAQAQSGRPVAWAQLAADLGYFDQAHFIADFRKLVGVTPGEYARAHPAAG